MIVEIVSVGTELLMGQIVNTDAAYLARRLPEAGATLYHQVTVGDNPERLKEALLTALSRSDVVITSGGLGPTKDDLTKDVAADALGLPMELNPDAERHLRGYFESRHRPMAANNLRQAYFARGAILLPNPNGTAPGCVVERDGKAVIHLPGPPREFVPMVEDSVLPYLAARLGGVIRSRYLRLFGIGESDAETRVAVLMDSANPTLAPYCSLGEVQFRLSARAQTVEDAEALLGPLEDSVRERVGEFIYARTDIPDDTMARIAMRRLIKSGKKLAIAESLTGGLLTASLVAQPGVSSVLEEAMITYANSSKTRRLGVPEETLRAYGAVSEQTARAMAEGVRAGAGADIGIATTGIAGPGGATPVKPVGLVYTALSTSSHTEVKRLELKGHRDDIRQLACLHATSMLLNELGGNYGR
ncbi:MAG: competence/damage-inducible protein A [Oscillospiraceae bacterium]|jgi:nicotinamide-nucleotide amidase|nr:competence/damage-inducible protein A [Oscillospiraceae bacterium]